MKKLLSVHAAPKIAYGSFRVTLRIRTASKPYMAIENNGKSFSRMLWGIPVTRRNSLEKYRNKGQSK